MTATRSPSIDPMHFRNVLGQLPTGVAVVCASGPDGQPVGMTVGSFGSVSLDPPLVSFMPAKSSQSWQALEASGGDFCVSILSAPQEGVCRAIAARSTDKFEGVSWRKSRRGIPIIEGCVAYVECTLHAVHDAGDHWVVLARVLELDVEVTDAYPLLFFRGGYGSFGPLSVAIGDPGLYHDLWLVDLVRPAMEQLAHDLDGEVEAAALVAGEMVVLAAAGKGRRFTSPARVGRRYPFVPPLGSAFVVWGDPQNVDLWLSDKSITPEHRKALHRLIERVGDIGAVVMAGHQPMLRVETLGAQLDAGTSDVSTAEFRDAALRALDIYCPEFRPGGEYDVRWVTAPVFGPDGRIALMITASGPPHPLSSSEAEELVLRIKEAAALASSAIADSPEGRKG